MEKKEIIKKLGNNNFTLTFNNSGKIYPWYVYHNSKKWLQLTEMNKISMIILDLIKKSIKIIKIQEIKNIFVLKYEDYVCEPVFNLKKISKFLRTNFSSQTIKKLKKLELPLNISAIEYKRNIRKRIIKKKKLDPKIYKELEKLEQAMKKIFMDLNNNEIL